LNGDDWDAERLGDVFHFFPAFVQLEGFHSHLGRVWSEVRVIREPFHGAPRRSAITGTGMRVGGAVVSGFKFRI
jgi:hypothetical protein